MLTISPAAKQLFCKPEEAETVTKSGFLLSEQAAEKPKIAEVINVGSGIKDYRAHDRVIYKPYTTTDIKLNGKVYFLIAEEDILGIAVEVQE